MTNEITSDKAALKTVLVSAGLNVLEYVPERIVPPIVIINSASPYLVPSSLKNQYVLNLELVLIAATAVNKKATEMLDELIQDTLQALPSYARIIQVNAPYNMQTNNAEYLATNIAIDLQITI
jgi:hypothetical protein